MRSDAELEMLNMTKAACHGEWNYTMTQKCSS